ncbi:hypothetical protein MSP8886_02747 [Marinomonas spartinae]|uniref:Uncharacterized protein n=1 Tax=Marinomonas spartinae TaxID=1792290 RepID=A0A1A8TIC4_9GAMM|nr:hypothetical protein MSP8886_02747 [Marinomonas spartinae]
MLFPLFLYRFDQVFAHSACLLTSPFSAIKTVGIEEAVIG